MIKYWPENSIYAFSYKNIFLLNSQLMIWRERKEKRKKNKLINTNDSKFEIKTY